MSSLYVSLGTKGDTGDSGARGPRGFRGKVKTTKFMYVPNLLVQNSLFLDIYQYYDVL